MNDLMFSLVSSPKRHSQLRPDSLERHRFEDLCALNEHTALQSGFCRSLDDLGLAVTGATPVLSGTETII